MAKWGGPFREPHLTLKPFQKKQKQKQKKKQKPNKETKNKQKQTKNKDGLGLSEVALWATSLDP